jgi:GTP-binding protein
LISQSNIRNIAIIAHVDHGKTTLVDAMLKQSGIFRSNEVVEDRVMDSNDLERERGITILAKNTSVTYQDIKINIVDTPGHADFGGEVERSLALVDGVILLVDAFEGCMPQTRFVLKKALSQNLKVIILVNKVDRPGARPHEVVDEVLDLFIDLGATDEQFDSPVVFASGREGWASLDPLNHSDNLSVLFDTIKNYIHSPAGDPSAPFQMLVSNIDYDEYTGRIAIGKIHRGKIKQNEPAVVYGHNNKNTKTKIGSLYVFEGLKRLSCDVAGTGEIVAISGFPEINIGDTVCSPDAVGPLPFIEIDQPVLSMNFSVNNSPFAGQDGQFVTSRHLRDRLNKELESNISLQVEETDTADTFKVSGRGELHLSVLIENMRRQGYEFQVSKPMIITKMIDGVECEPMERMMIDVPETYSGTVIENAGRRGAELLNITQTQGSYTRLEFLISSRGLIGFRNALLTMTKGTSILNHIFEKHQPVKETIPSRTRGSLVAFEAGKAVTYGLYNAQERGELFISPNIMVYEGMVVGENNRSEDIVVNVCKKKHVTNMRASGSDDALRLIPPRIMSLEQCLEFIADDELLEITPKELRIRKKILNAEQRMKEKNKK